MQTLFFRPWRRSAALALGWALASMAAHAQAPHTPVPDPAAWSLRALFDHAWQRQPEAQAQPLRQQAAEATRLAAQRWTAEPPALQLQTRTDRPGSQQGQREVEVGLAAPLWLPGERARSAALGDAQWQQVQSQQRAAQWQLAAQVRQAWWDWQRARSALALAQDRLHSARQLAADVQRRWQAGDLARTDGLQAQAVVAQAEAAQAEAQGALQAARAALSAWGALPGTAPGAPAPQDWRAEPLADAAAQAVPDTHPALAQAQAQAQVARHTAELAAVQRRANPELSVAATRGRDQAGERYRQSVTLGLRIPLGDNALAQAKEAAAQADALEQETRLQRERERLAQDLHAAQARVAAAQAQSDAAARHAALVQETLGHVDKAFRLGEADWPTRLRAEQDAAQAQRQLARARIDAAAAVSALRQALGLLPE
ncbi:TolC family protein [Acidovorax sp. 210-6]|uniref:TolC family protein n=1 Tax=Acidovorax sp. 210-6 TaxID=2699468 RepID=UPI001389B4D6|nr:TolC family protein [Acidovorax sp. 210-6]NCU65330.1 TolC family protein [Acidovorax sp. 210-6]